MTIFRFVLKKKRIEKYVREGKQTLDRDLGIFFRMSFLTSGESCVRNLLTGMESAKKIWKIESCWLLSRYVWQCRTDAAGVKQAGMEA